MTQISALAEKIAAHFGEKITCLPVAQGQLTLEVPTAHFHAVCLALRNIPSFLFNQLVDVCGVDYLAYGVSDWMTEETTFTGFSRAVNKDPHPREEAKRPRFAAVYHLLSLPLNHRVRLRVYLEEAAPTVDSVVDIWPAANWFEREAFDLFGIVFTGHPDLRRILTDYDFEGHPFRKDFPLIGNVEMRYDAATERCVYEPVSIQPRTLVPKVIRSDARYVRPDQKKED